MTNKQKNEFKKDGMRIGIGFDEPDITVVYGHVPRIAGIYADIAEDFKDLMVLFSKDGDAYQHVMDVLERAEKEGSLTITYIAGRWVPWNGDDADYPLMWVERECKMGEKLGSGWIQATKIELVGVTCFTCAVMSKIHPVTCSKRDECLAKPFQCYVEPTISCKDCQNFPIDGPRMYFYTESPCTLAKACLGSSPPYQQYKKRAIETESLITRTEIKK